MKSKIEGFTESENKIAFLVKDGLSSKDISDLLSISKRTVDVHRHNIFKKLKIKRVASLISIINSQSGDYKKSATEKIKTLNKTLELTYDHSLRKEIENKIKALLAVV